MERFLTLFRALRDVSHARYAGTSWSRSNDTPEHLPIARAILAKNEQNAATAMEWHIESAAKALEEALFSAGT